MTSPTYSGTGFPILLATVPRVLPKTALVRLARTRFLLQPIPFSVRVYDPPSLFSGKMHALLCRGWQSRLKGRDWYDFVWYVGRGTELDERAFRAMLAKRISELDVAAARSEVLRFLPDPSTVRVWSRAR